MIDDLGIVEVRMGTSVCTNKWYFTFDETSVTSIDFLNDDRIVQRSNIGKRNRESVSVRKSKGGLRALSNFAIMSSAEKVWKPAHDMPLSQHREDEPWLRGDNVGKHRCS